MRGQLTGGRHLVVGAAERVPSLAGVLVEHKDSAGARDVGVVVTLFGINEPNPENRARAREKHREAQHMNHQRRSVRVSSNRSWACSGCDLHHLAYNARHRIHTVYYHKLETSAANKS